MEKILDLLELVQPINAVVEKKPENEYVLRAKAAGFLSVNGSSHAVSELPYPEITLKAIENFLRKIVKQPEPQFQTWAVNPQLYVPSVSVGWNEVDVSKYDGTPPMHVISSLERARATELFERFSVVTIEEIQDPLLIGHRQGKRYLIDYWGKDIDPLDVV